MFCITIDVLFISFVKKNFLKVYIVDSYVRIYKKEVSMKRIFIIILLMFIAVPAFGAVDTWFNTNPYKKYDKSIELQKVYNEVYDKDGIKIEKNMFKFKYSYKEGNPYEYVITNNTGNDLMLKGVDSDYHANKNITRKSHWTRVNARYLKYWQSYIPLVGEYNGVKGDIEKNPYLYDFPKDYTIKKGESLRILAMGLDLDRIQSVTFIFDGDLKISF